jgi:hypothetical protein
VGHEPTEEQVPEVHNREVVTLPSPLFVNRRMTEFQSHYVPADGTRDGHQEGERGALQPHLRSPRCTDTEGNSVHSSYLYLYWFHKHFLH